MKNYVCPVPIFVTIRLIEGFLRKLAKKVYTVTTVTSKTKIGWRLLMSRRPYYGEGARGDEKNERKTADERKIAKMLIRQR